MNFNQETQALIVQHKLSNKPTINEMTIHLNDSIKRLSSKFYYRYFQTSNQYEIDDIYSELFLSLRNSINAYKFICPKCNEKCEDPKSYYYHFLTEHPIKNRTTLPKPKTSFLVYMHNCLECKAKTLYTKTKNNLKHVNSELLVTENHVTPELEINDNEEKIIDNIRIERLINNSKEIIFETCNDIYNNCKVSKELNSPENISKIFYSTLENRDKKEIAEIFSKTFINKFVLEEIENFVEIIQNRIINYCKEEREKELDKLKKI